MARPLKTRAGFSSFRCSYPCVCDEGFAALESAPGLSEFRLDVEARAQIERALVAARHQSNAEYNPIYDAEVRKHFVAVKNGLMREGNDPAGLWFGPIGNDAFSEAKIRVGVIAEERGIDLHRMTPNGKAQLAAAIDDSLKSEPERNPPHAPKQHWGLGQLVLTLAIEFQRASGLRITKTGFNRNAEGKPCGRFFRFVKTALRFVPEAHRVPLKDEQIARIITTNLREGRSRIENAPVAISFEQSRANLEAALDWLEKAPTFDHPDSRS